MRGRQKENEKSTIRASSKQRSQQSINVEAISVGEGVSEADISQITDWLRAVLLQVFELSHMVFLSH